MRPIAVSLPFKQATFIPAGCIHWPICEKDKVRRWVRAVATKPNAFTILMGDTQDAARTHYRDYIRGYRQDANSQLALDEYIKRDVADLAKELQPIKDRIIGAIRGNHYWEFSDGTNSEQLLCQILGIPYLGAVGVVRVEFREGGKGKIRDQIVIFAHHDGGSKGGRTTGGDVNALERQEQAWDADIYCLSHTHRRIAYKMPKLCIPSRGYPHVIESTRVFVRTGAFLKGYGEDNPSATKPHTPSYAETRAYRPTDLGWVEVEIAWRRPGPSGQDPRPPLQREFRVSY